jgi:hypothetical protein
MELYRTDGLVLFLGAGVSLRSGIPNWVVLSESMLKEVDAPPPEKLDPNDLNRVKKLLERFDQVYERLDRRQFLFLEKLYHCLYGKRLDRRISGQQEGCNRR